MRTARHWLDGRGGRSGARWGVLSPAKGGAHATPPGLWRAGGGRLGRAALGPLAQDQDLASAPLMHRFTLGARARAHL